MAVSKFQQKAVHKYVKANYDRVELTVPKGRKDEIKAHAEAQGESVNGFINRAINNQISQDRRKGPSEAPESTEGCTAGLTSYPPSERKLRKRLRTALQQRRTNCITSGTTRAYVRGRSHMGQG